MTGDHTFEKSDTAICKSRISTSFSKCILKYFLRIFICGMHNKEYNKNGIRNSRRNNIYIKIKTDNHICSMY